MNSLSIRLLSAFVALSFTVPLMAGEGTVPTKVTVEGLPESNATWVLQEIDDEELRKGRIVQGCCGNKTTGVCAAPVLKRHCTKSGYVWKKGKNCYEKNKTGCMD